MYDANILSSVISVISEAAEGNRELDVRISAALGELRSESAKLLKLFLEEDYSWQVVSALLESQVPAYTTSLDAKVPGENVVAMLYSAKRDRWMAVHRGPDGREEDPVWAASEALARRAAGLAGLVAATGGEPAAAPGGESIEAAGDPGEAGLETEGEDEPPEWKILF